MLPLLFLLADVEPPPLPAAPLESTRVTLALGATGAPQSSTYVGAGSNASGARGNGAVGITVYPWTPLLDDSSPRSLQPFLQRTSYLELDGGGQYLGASYSLAAGGGTYTQDYVPATLATRIFFLPAFAFLGSLGADYLHDVRTPAVAFPTTRDVWEPWAQVGLDARSGDASLSLQWQFVAVQETVTGGTRTLPTFFPARLSLAGRIVLDHRFDVTTSVGVIPDGVAVRAGFAAYPTQDLGLSLFAEVDHGQIYWDTTTVYDALRGGPALTYWLSPRAQLSLSYTPQWTSWGSGDSELEQSFTLGFTARVP